MSLEPRIEAIRKEYDLQQSDFWQIKQNGQWVCKHSALEIVAVKAGVEFDLPIIIEKDAVGLVTSMIVRGVSDKLARTEWATGETNPSNYHVSGKQPSYPWAMAEKRAKDRVILKLVGIHGLVYSEDEMADVSAPPPKASTEPVQAKSSGLTAGQRKELYGSLKSDLEAESAKGVDAIASFMNNQSIKLEIAKLDGWSADFRREAAEIYKLAKAAEDSGMGPIRVKASHVPDFDSLQTSEPDALDEALAEMEKK